LLIGFDTGIAPWAFKFEDLPTDASGHGTFGGLAAGRYWATTNISDASSFSFFTITKDQTAQQITYALPGNPTSPSPSAGTPSPTPNGLISTGPN
jgi:hypothetical protein